MIFTSDIPGGAGESLVGSTLNVNTGSDPVNSVSILIFNSAQAVSTTGKILIAARGEGEFIYHPNRQ